MYSSKNVSHVDSTGHEIRVYFCWDATTTRTPLTEDRIVQYLPNMIYEHDEQRM